MSSSIVFLPEARAEFDEDANWYEKRQRGLGRKFTLAVNAVLERIAKNPQMHGVVLEDVRKAIVSGFPYCVYYREDGGNLVVLSVFHSSRAPAFLRIACNVPAGNFQRSDDARPVKSA